MLEPCVYIITGSTGHLSRTKLLPSLYHLDAKGQLPDGTAIICVGRRDWNEETWRQESTDSWKSVLANSCNV